MGYDKYAVADTVAVEPTFVALANKRPWPLVPFFQISLKKSELKTIHNTFRDCYVHFCPTTFLEIAVCMLCTFKSVNK